MPKINFDICKGCGICMYECPNDAITIKDQKAKIIRALCDGCEVCVESCPNGAIIPERRRRGYTYHRPRFRYPLYPYHPYSRSSYFPRHHRWKWW